jgi:hypothetical protein
MEVDGRFLRLHTSTPQFIEMFARNFIPAHYQELSSWGIER